MAVTKHDDPEHGLDHLGFQHNIRAQRIDIDGAHIHVIKVRHKAPGGETNFHLSDKNGEALRDQLIALFPLPQKVSVNPKK